MSSPLPSEPPIDRPRVEFDVPRPPIGRPVGVSILAVLHLLGGALLLVVLFFMMGNTGQMKQALDLIGMPVWLLLIGVAFLALLALASGVGMWIGSVWGWWLAAFYYVYGVYRNIAALMTVPSLAAELGESPGELNQIIAKHTVRLVIHFLLFLYFFKANVRAFFGTEKVGKAKASMILLGIGLLLTVIVTVAGALGRA